jgi:hypothetical protein
MGKVLGAVGSIAGGLIGGSVGGPVGAKIGSSLGGALGGAINGKGATDAGTSSVENKNVPSWLLPDLQQQAATARELSAKPLAAYEGQRVAQLTGDELQAQQYARNLGAGVDLSYAQDINRQIAQQGLQGPSQAQLAQYINPYQTQVMDASRQRQLQQYDLNKRQLQQQQGQTGAFGGSRSAIAQGQLQDQFAQQLSQNEANQLFQGYSDAQNRAMQGAQLAGNAAQQYGQGQLQQYESAQQGMKGLSASGALTRGLEQQGLDNKYQAFLTAQQEPYERLKKYQDIINPLADKTTGRSTTGATTEARPSSLMQGLGVGTSLAGSGLFSGFGGYEAPVNSKDIIWDTPAYDDGGQVSLSEFKNLSPLEQEQYYNSLVEDNPGIQTTGRFIPNINRKVTSRTPGQKPNYSTNPKEPFPHDPAAADGERFIANYNQSEAPSTRDNMLRALTNMTQKEFNNLNPEEYQAFADLFAQDSTAADEEEYAAGYAQGGQVGYPTRTTPYVGGQQGSLSEYQQPSAGYDEGLLRFGAAILGTKGTDMEALSNGINAYADVRKNQPQPQQQQAPSYDSSLSAPQVQPQPRRLPAPVAPKVAQAKQKFVQLAQNKPKLPATQPLAITRAFPNASKAIGSAANVLSAPFKSDTPKYDFSKMSMEELLQAQKNMTK